MNTQEIAAIAKEMRRLREAVAHNLPFSVQQLRSLGLTSQSAEFIAYAANHALTLVDALDAERLHADRLAEAFRHEHSCIGDVATGPYYCQTCTLLAEHDERRSES